MSTTTIPEYTRDDGTYARTPDTCPDTGHWTTTVTFWWADGQTDGVDSTQPCAAA